MASSFRLVVRFTTRQVEVTQALDRKSAAGAIPSYAVDAVVTVLYGPTNPFECEVMGRSLPVRTIGAVGPLVPVDAGLHITGAT